MISKIISGAQVGADRGGLDAAIALGVPIGGWAPRGWLAEDGTIPEVYRAHMRETASKSYPERTRYNVRDSDATVIFRRVDSDGSRLTEEFCERLRRPYLLLAGDLVDDPERCAPKIVRFLNELNDYRNQDSVVLNVAGNRESRAPGIQRAVEAIMRLVIADCPICAKCACHHKTEDCEKYPGEAGQ